MVLCLNGPAATQARGVEEPAVLQTIDSNNSQPEVEVRNGVGVTQHRQALSSLHQGS